MRTLPALAFLTAALAGLGLGACAMSDSSATASIRTPTTTASILTPVSASSVTPAQVSGYTLSGDELEFDCKRLMGRMQIRILEIRDYNERTTTTAAARALQSGATSVFGGPKAGIDPGGSYARGSRHAGGVQQAIGR